MADVASLRASAWRASAAAALILPALVAPGCRKAATAPEGATARPVRKAEASGATPAKGAADDATQGAALAPVVEVQHDDYAQARSRFRSRLLRQGPAPQPWSPVKPPAGAVEVEYPSGDLRLRAWVNRPAEEGRRRPAVLFLHGGFAFDRDDWAVSQPYRDAGFVVLTPMLRAENGQAGSFTLFYDEVDDVLAAAEFLSKQPYVDAKRLYVAGSSAGGTLALLAAEASPCFRAAASFSASPDQALLVKHAKVDLPFDKEDPRELQLRSPLAYAASFKCPVRIYYATQDHFVRTSQRTAELAKERGLDVEAVRMEGNHGSIVPPGVKLSIPFFQGK
jgi:dipeptidyl aminopeptidase/acylaminoacyl peptidase